MNNEDLPLSANIKDIRVRHHIMVMFPDLPSYIIYGKLILVMSPSSQCEKTGNVCLKSCNCRTQLETSPLERSVHFPEKLVLDLNDLHIRSIDKIYTSPDTLNLFLDPMKEKNNAAASMKLFSAVRKELYFVMKSSSVEISLPTPSNENVIAVLVDYHTLPNGASLLWRATSDGSPSVFTAAAAINNRSLLPYQDAPGAMGTWEAHVFMPDTEFHVSMTSDTKPCHAEVNDFSNELFEMKTCDCSSTDFSSSNPDSLQDKFHHYYFYSSLLLPLATLALAIGKWKEVEVWLPEELIKYAIDNEENKELQISDCQHAPYICHIEEKVKKITLELPLCSKSSPQEWCKNNFYDIYAIPITVVYDPEFEEKIYSLIKIVPFCLMSAVSLFGPYPCSRLEIVILPKTFASLGFASPNLVFFNPSVIASEDSLMVLRLSHEIS